MAYKALYRTYRPTTFEEVAGQQHIVRTLKNALATGKIAHAYLFAGPRGTGKTTMAKLLAKALNCDEGIGRQCNDCKNCISINEGAHPDVLEIDAASNNGVDEIRELIDKVKYGTILGRYKVYIIDEVHMMTPGAFNALLKTLEEPPEHVIFILATTEPHKILPTILSRCQRYDFTKVGENDIRERIKVILQQEGIVFDEDAVNLIISLADGGMRDALSILDQVLAYSGNTLNVQDILEIFALESTEEKLNLLNSIVEGDVGDVLNRLNSYILRGTDIKRLTNDLLIILKDVLIYGTSRSSQYCEILKEEEVQKLVKSINNKTAIQMIDVLMSTLKDYKNVAAINPLFEVTLLKLASLKEDAIIIPQVEQKIVKEEVKQEKISDIIAALEQEEKAKEEVKTEEVKPEEPIIINENVIYIDGTEEINNFKVNDELMIDIMVSSKKDLKKSFLENWNNLKRLTPHPQLGKCATMLIDGHPLVVSNNVLILEYPLPNTVERVNLKANQEDLQNVITNVFGKKMFVYAVSRSESVRLQGNYMNLLQVGKLPKAKDVVINMIGE